MAQGYVFSRIITPYHIAFI